MSYILVPLLWLALFFNLDSNYDWERCDGNDDPAECILLPEDRAIREAEPQALVNRIWADWELGRWAPRIRVSQSHALEVCGGRPGVSCAWAGGIAMAHNRRQTVLHETAHTINNLQGRHGHGLDFRCIAAGLYLDYGEFAPETVEKLRFLGYVCSLT